MSNKIVKAELWMVDLKPKVKRTDAIQAFESQETPILKITTEDGSVGVGYTYTIGTGGSSVIALLKDHLLPKLLGRDAAMVEAIWDDLLKSTHSTSIGVITSLSLAAIDTALWDLRCKRANQPLYKLAGGRFDKIRLYTTEGGWLHLTPEELINDAQKVKSEGFVGSKVKIGLTPNQDIARLTAVREAMGADYTIKTDANQSMTLADAQARVREFEKLGIGWIEEPFLAHDVASHAMLNKSTTIPVAVGESIYSIHHFMEYLKHEAAEIIQVDVARIGGITPWLKVAHMAECFNKVVCPHFLMELHVSLCCAVNNSRWLEYIPQLDSLTHTNVEIKDGFAYPPNNPGLGIDWNWEIINEMSTCHHEFEV